MQAADKKPDPGDDTDFGSDSAESVGDEDAEAVSSVDSKSTEKMLTPPPSSADHEIDTITKSMSSLKFVPPSVRFGRGRGRGFARP